MQSRVAVEFEPGKPLKIVEIDVEPPRKGEVLVKLAPVRFSLSQAAGG